MTSFDLAYEGTPTWDLGRPQAAVVRLETGGRIRGVPAGFAVLDALLAPEMVLLCWSERNAWGLGPRRVSHLEIRGTFHDGWVVESIDDETYETSLDVEIHAWLAALRRCYGMAR